MLRWCSSFSISVFFLGVYFTFLDSDPVRIGSLVSLSCLLCISDALSYAQSHRYTKLAKTDPLTSLATKRDGQCDGSSLSELFAQ